MFYSCEINLIGGEIDCTKYALKLAIRNFKALGMDDVCEPYERVLKKIDRSVKEYE